MNIFENDFITVRGKKQAAQHIVERYGDFGWKLTKTEDDKLYADITYMSFTRPHFIENKDELQLLQVRLDIAFNNTGKLAHKSKRRATRLSNFFALLAVCLAVGGVFMIILLSGLAPVIGGSLLISLAVAVGVAGGLVARIIYKRDKKKYALLLADEVKKIDGLCSRARELRCK